MATIGPARPLEGEKHKKFILRQTPNTYYACNAQTTQNPKSYFAMGAKTTNKKLIGIKALSGVNSGSPIGSGIPK